jgi:tRNA1Val (adenine37-N6)-methyltransferase
MRLVHPRIETPASVLLIEARRGGGVGVTIEPPLVIYSKKGLYTEETRNLLGVDSPIE